MKETEESNNELPPINPKLLRNKSDLLKAASGLTSPSDKEKNSLQSSFPPIFGSKSTFQGNPSDIIKAFTPKNSSEYRSFREQMPKQDSFSPKQTRFIFSETKKNLPGFTQEELARSEVLSPSKVKKLSIGRKQRSHYEETPVRVFSNSISTKEPQSTQESPNQKLTSYELSPDTYVGSTETRMSKRMRNLSVGLERLAVKERVQTASGRRDSSSGQLSPVTITFNKSKEGNSAGIKGRMKKETKTKKVQNNSSSLGGPGNLQNLIIESQEKKKHAGKKLVEQKELMDQLSPIFSSKLKLKVFTKPIKTEAKSKGFQPPTPLLVESLIDSPLRIISLNKKKLQSGSASSLLGSSPQSKDQAW